MRKLLLNLCYAILLVCFTSCSSEDIQDSNDSSIVGVWTLNAWNIEDGFDMNNDGTVSTNLLNEIDCDRNETLFFDKNGVVSLNTTFNPDINISLLNSETNTYNFDVTCDTEGVVSLATEYSIDDSMIAIGESVAKIENGQIFLVFEDRIKIYNEDFTEVIETKDLTLVYSKK
ncbi:hypothetical protein DIS18_01025 [Algibacter marinivivus]|uniref:Lipocalin-like domain-containing protein n=1 Tax=Algibacter marinivivus TaxID=2100723 RepID=A0A2U2X5U9_9FLAO|nr:hypothetical protein [Algibacter marinivivus]PWH83168.1 hypothetical protein DIS18_01025 [Algibacter marinivivus]